MRIITKKKNYNSPKTPQSCTTNKHETESSSSDRAYGRKRRYDNEEKDDYPAEYRKKEYQSFDSVYNSAALNSVSYNFNREIGVMNHSKFSKFQKSAIINNLSRFKVCEVSSPFERRVTSIAWHPKYPKISVAGSKGGDLLLHRLKKKNDVKSMDDYFIAGIGSGGSVLGLKFCNDDPCTVYTASMTGKICREDFNKQNSKVLLCLPLSWDNWYTCLDICHDRNLLLSGDCSGNSYLLNTSGELVWKEKRMHVGKISHCEFNMNDPNMFVTSSIDRSVKLWDMRAISESKYTQPLMEIFLDKGVNSACFSQSNHVNLLITDQHSELRVHSSPCWNESLVITHPHRHFQHMTSIKAVWHPTEDIIIVGRYPDDKIQLGDHRTIDFYDGLTGELLHQIHSPSGNLVSLNAVNSSGDAIFSAAGYHVVYLQDKNIVNGVSCSHGSTSESGSSKSNMRNMKTKPSTKTNKNIKGAKSA